MTGSAATSAATGRQWLRVAVLLCGVASAFGIEIMGQLYWAELLLPVLAVGVMSAGMPRELFANGPFRILMLGVVLMLAGYILSDLAAGTAPQMYLRGWARVAALGSSAFSLCVLCHRDSRSLWCFCVGMGVGGVAANLLAGVPLLHWKLGYGEPVANLVAATGAFLPLWVACLAVTALGGLTILLDYRSLGVMLVLTAAATFLRQRQVGFDRLLRNMPLLVLGFGLAAAGSMYLLNVSRGENLARWEVSSIGRFAALRIGTQAIIDSPLVGYGSWGQGTRKYADMMYEETLGDLLSVGDDSIVGNPDRGSYFSAHSQVIQAWMEGGILAGAFFIAYIVLLVRGFHRLLFTRAADYLTPLLVLTFGLNLWASVMSPFLGNQRITVALTMAALVMLSMEPDARAVASRSVRAGPAALRRPVNLMR